MRSIVLAILLGTLSVSVTYAEDGLDEIIQRCRTQMGEYGPTMVKGCVDQDVKAVIALGKNKEIQNKYRGIYARCYQQMKEYGYSMIKACTDQDIKAEKALSNYKK